MINEKLMRKLLQKNPIEVEQAKTHQFVNDMSADLLIKKNQKIIINQKLLSHHSIYVSKHNRFAPYPKHSHLFVEVNYMLHGQCRETVNGQKIILHQGDILIMDIGSSHSIAALGPNDLLINLLFNDRNISFDFLDQIHAQNNLVYRFLMNIFLQNRNTRKFMLFPHNSDISETMDQIIEEYFSHRSYRSTIISDYFNILLAKIIRNYRIPEPGLRNNQQQLMVSLLRQIANHYQDITLSDLARRYDYTKPYLSSLIKKLTGYSFVQLRMNKRMEEARNLLRTTNFNIDEICDRVGIHNYDSFYQRFKTLYHCSPGKYRREYLTQLRESWQYL